MSVTIDGSDVSCRIWRQNVGATQLILLDTDVDTNTTEQRKITDRLYPATAGIGWIKNWSSESEAYVPCVP